MSVLVAVTDNPEGCAALVAAGAEARLRGTVLVAVNLTGAALDLAVLDLDPDGSDWSQLDVETLTPPVDRLDEVEQVLRAVDERPEVDLVVVGVRRRSPVGKVVLGSIPQRLVLEVPKAVLCIKAPTA